PEKLTCIRDRAVRLRLSSPSRPVANIHTGMAALERNCELSAVGALGRHQWREDLRPTPAAIGRAPDTLLKSRRVQGVVTPVIRIEFDVVHPANCDVAVPNKAEGRATVG